MRAVQLGCALREEMVGLTERWRKRGYDLDLGAGIALGFATCGEVGFDGRSDYAAIGSVTNLASRLADEATGGQVLITQRLYAEVEGSVGAVPAVEFALKGFTRSVPAFDVVGVRESAELDRLGIDEGSRRRRPPGRPPVGSPPRNTEAGPVVALCVSCIASTDNAVA